MTREYLVFDTSKVKDGNIVEAVYSNDVHNAASKFLSVLKDKHKYIMTKLSNTAYDISSKEKSYCIILNRKYTGKEENKHTFHLDI